MDPANREIFRALIKLATGLPPADIIRGAIAAGWLDHAEHLNTPYGTNDLRIAFDKENFLDEQKARRSLCLLARQWIVDVENDRVQAALGESGLEFAGDEFRRLERQAPVSELVLPSITMKAGDKLDPGDTQRKTVEAQAIVIPAVSAKLIRANRLAASDAVPVEQVQTEHATSLASLKLLWDTLDGLHGSDATGRRNTQESQLTEAELSDLRSVVKSAIELHQVRSFSGPMVDAHKAVLNVLDGLNEIIQKLSKTVKALGDLGEQIDYAVKAWAVLIAAVAAFFI